MKNFLKLLPAFIILLALLVGCDKGDMKIKKLNHGDGTWTIESIHYQYYDSLGHGVVSESNVTSGLGELIFFKTTTLDALYDYHLVVANIPDPAGTTISAYRGEVFFDTDRVDFQTTLSGDPFPFLGTWSVDKSNRHKQEWSSFALRTDGTLFSKTTISLQKK